jgi:hypothetical protein
MLRLRENLLILVASIIHLSGDPSFANEVCKPDLTFKSVKFSDAQNLQRKWTAVLDVNAARCATNFGRFEVRFLREKENALELDFAEGFMWHTGELKTGQIEISIEFWIDEAVQHYAIDYVAPCACRPPKQVQAN